MHAYKHSRKYYTPHTYTVIQTHVHEVSSFLFVVFLFAHFSLTLILIPSSTFTLHPIHYVLFFQCYLTLYTTLSPSLFKTGVDIVAFQCRNPIHRAHYELFTRALDDPMLRPGAVVSTARKNYGENGICFFVCITFVNSKSCSCISRTVSLPSLSHKNTQTLSLLTFFLTFSLFHSFLSGACAPHMRPHTTRWHPRHRQVFYCSYYECTDSSFPFLSSIVPTYFPPFLPSILTFFPNFLSILDSLLFLTTSFLLCLHIFLDVMMLSSTLHIITSKPSLSFSSHLYYPPPSSHCTTCPCHRYKTYEVLKEQTNNPRINWAYLPYSMHMAGPRGTCVR